MNKLEVKLLINFCLCERLFASLSGQFIKKVAELFCGYGRIMYFCSRFWNSKMR